MTFDDREPAGSSALRPTGRTVRIHGDSYGESGVARGRSDDYDSTGVSMSSSLKGVDASRPGFVPHLHPLPLRVEWLKPPASAAASLSILNPLDSRVYGSATRRRQQIDRRSTLGAYLGVG